MRTTPSTSRRWGNSPSTKAGAIHQPTIDYVARRTAEGKSKRDIIRCLKRYVIRELYHLVKVNPRTGEIVS